MKNAKSLTHLVIGDNCFTDASVFEVDNELQLAYLHIDSNAFTNVTVVDLSGKFLSLSSLYRCSSSV